MMYNKSDKTKIQKAVLNKRKKSKQKMGKAPKYDIFFI
jgi:hypothetical protein